MISTRFKPAVFFIAASLLTANFAYSQSCCGRVALPVGGIEQRPLLKGQYDFRLSYENSLLDKTVLGNTSVDDPLDRSNKTQIISASISYGFTDRLTGIIVVSFKWTSLSLLDNRVIRKTSGAGDILGLVKFKITAPISPKEPELAIGLGLKVPTGGYADRDFFGTLSSSQQVGSGAFDFIAVAYYNQLVNRFLVHLNSIFRYPTKNDKGYRFGKDAVIGGKIIYADLISRLNPFLGFRNRFAGRDSYDGSPNDSYGGGAYRDSGGNWGFLSPGIEFRPARSLGLQFEIDIPVYANLNGRQISESFVWRVATSFNNF